MERSCCSCLAVVSSGQKSGTEPLVSATTVVIVDGHSVDGIASRYGLHIPGIDSRYGRDFPPPPRRAVGVPQVPIR
jgi:hypothetical protein